MALGPARVGLGVQAESPVIPQHPATLPAPEEDGAQEARLGAVETSLVHLPGLEEQDTDWQSWGSGWDPVQQHR